jgi:hypothetical protein
MPSSRVTTIVVKFLILILGLISMLHADPAAAPAAAPEPKADDDKPNIIRLDDGRMKLGDITFDPKTREVRVPCTVNMREGLLEFAVVHENGKVHEALLVTKCSPTDINIAMKLLRYTASEELYAIERERGVLTDKYPEVPEAIRKAARVDLKVEWEKDGKSETVALADWIMHSQTTKPMGQEPWIYGGSLVYDGSFVAELTGDIASIFVARGSLLLYPGKDNFNDETWLPQTKRIPPEGTTVYFIIQPHKP